MSQEPQIFVQLAAHKQNVLIEMLLSRLDSAKPASQVQASLGSTVVNGGDVYAAIGISSNQ